MLNSMFNMNLKIKGESVYLKNLREKDATEDYCRWLNDPGVNKYLETRKVTIEGLKKYIKEKNTADNCLFLCILDRESGKHIGNIKLEPIDFESKKAVLGILIGDKNYWGKGIGTEATKLLVDYAFNNLNIKEVNLGVISENKAAIRVYEKAGFKTTKIEKDAIDHDGKKYDKIIMSKKHGEKIQ